MAILVGLIRKSKDELMKIADILQEDSVFLDTTSETKKQLLTELAILAHQKTGLDQDVVFDALIERERLGTTGIGRGVALPHIRLGGLKKIFCAFLKTHPLDFESVDSKQVDLVFFLVVPEEAGSDHLKALSHLSKLLRDDEVTKALRGTDNVDSLYKIIVAHDTDD